MPYGDDPDVLEVVGGQPRQHRPIDCVLGETRYVLRQFEPIFGLKWDGF